MDASRGGPVTTTPPAEYRTVSTLDLKADRRSAITIQGGVALTVAAAVTLALLLDLPLDSGWAGWVVTGVTVAAVVAYLVVHELTHGVALWSLTRVRPTYAVRLPYLTTGSPALLTRRDAVITAVAPLVLWGGVLGALWLVLPQDALLTVYVLLALNVAGSVGDVVQAWTFSRLPADALVRDDGTTTTVFLPAA